MITFSEDEIIPDDFTEKTRIEVLEGVIETLILEKVDNKIKYKKRIAELEYSNQLAGVDTQKLIETILLKDKEIDKLNDQIKWYESL